MISWGLGGRKQGFKQMIKTAFQHFPNFNSYTLVWLLLNQITIYLLLCFFSIHCVLITKKNNADHLFFFLIAYVTYTVYPKCSSWTWQKLELFNHRDIRVPYFHPSKNEVHRHRLGKPNSERLSIFFSTSLQILHLHCNTVNNILDYPK